MAMQHEYVSGDELIYSNLTTLYGYSFKCTADAEIILRDGDDSTGEAVVFIYLLAGQSIRDEFTRGISFSNGLFVDIVSGTVEGSVWSDQS